MHLKTVPALALGAVAPVAIHWLGKEVVEADQASVDIGLSLLCSLSVALLYLPSRKTLSASSMLKEQHMPRSVGRVLKMEEQLTRIP